MMRDMDLITYIKGKGGSAKADCPVLAYVAGRSDCSPRTLYMVALGHKKPGPKLAINIETATGGDVSRSSLRPDYWPAEAA